MKRADLSVADLLVWLRRDLRTKETSYPVRVAGKRMTEEEAAKNLLVVRSIIARLEGGDETVPRPAPKPKPPVDAARLELLEKSLEAIRVCATEHTADCIHCASVANLVLEVTKP